MDRPALWLLFAVVVVLAASADAQGACGQTLANNTGLATASTVTKPFLGVRFQVLSQSANVTRFDAPLTSPNGVDAAALYPDNSGQPSSAALSGATLVITDLSDGFIATPAAGGVVLAPGVYWLVADTGNTGHWDSASVTTPAGSELVVLLGLASRANPNQAWSVDTAKAFKLSVTGCAAQLPTPSVTRTPSATPSLSPSASLTPSTTPSPSVMRTPSPSTTPSPTPSTTRTPSPSITPTPTTSPTPSPSSSPTPSITPTPSTTPTPTPSTTSMPSASPSATPLLSLRVTNVTSSFETNAAGVNLTATILGTNGTATEGAAALVTVRTDFDSLRIGDTEVPASSLTNLSLSQQNETTFAYSANAEATAVDQEFSFYRVPASGNFFGHLFHIAPNTVKWSIRLSSSSNSSSSSPTERTTARYRLTSLLASSPPSPSLSLFDFNGKVTRRSGVPRANMTTYYIPLLSSSSSSSSSRAVARLEVFDIVLLTDDSAGAPFDQRLAAVEHSVTVRSAEPVNGGVNASAAEFVLELRFPPFNGSLSYDPSLGFDVLLGTHGGDDGNGGDNTGVVVGLAVALPLAAVAVVAAIAVMLFVGWRRRRRTDKRMVVRDDSIVNFHYYDEPSPDSHL